MPVQDGLKENAVRQAFNEHYLVGEEQALVIVAVDDVEQVLCFREYGRVQPEDMALLLLAKYPRYVLDGFGRHEGRRVGCHQKLVSCGCGQMHKQLKKRLLPFGMEVKLRLVDNDQGIPHIQSEDREQVSEQFA